MTNNRLGTKGVPRLQALLNERDNRILRTIYEHKFLTTRQVHRLHFWNHASYSSGIRACTRVLARLESHRLIYRLDRPIGGTGGGSTSHVWGLDAAGDRLMRATINQDGKRARAFEPTLMFLAHTLAVAETRIVIEELARTTPIELLDVVTEPRNWRPFLAPSGSSMTLKPDLYAVTAAGEFEDHWYIEVDRGTESIPTLLRKCEYYQGYHRTGEAQDQLGVFPRVLWIVPAGARRDRLRDAIRQHGRINAELFLVINPTELTTVIESSNDINADIN
jgi:hypothetical protein